MSYLASRRAGPAACLFTAYLLACSACTPSGAAGRAVVQSQQQAIAALAAAYAQDLALLRAQLAATLDIQRINLLGGIHRGLFEHGLITPALSADTDALTDLIAQSAAQPAEVNPPLALLAAVQSGAVSTAAAHDWLLAYAAALKQGEEAARAALLAELPAVAAHDQAAAALLEAFSAHAAQVIAWFSSLEADAQVLAIAMNHAPGERIASLTLWENIIMQIEDEQLQQTARLILEAAKPAHSPAISQPAE